MKTMLFRRVAGTLAVVAMNSFVALAAAPVPASLTLPGFNASVSTSGAASAAGGTATSPAGGGDATFARLACLGCGITAVTAIYFGWVGWGMFLHNPGVQGLTAACIVACLEAVESFQ